MCMCVCVCVCVCARFAVQGYRVQGSEFRVQRLVKGLGTRVQGWVFRVQGCLRLQGLEYFGGYRIQNFRFRV